MMERVVGGAALVVVAAYLVAAGVMSVPVGRTIAWLTRTTPAALERVRGLTAGPATKTTRGSKWSSRGATKWASSLATRSG